MARWKETRDESYRYAVQSFFEPTDFLRTLRDWLLFYVEDGEGAQDRTAASISAVPWTGSSNVVPIRGKQRGLIWHTQGSGKTFTLLTAARLVLAAKDAFGNPTVVVVVGPHRTGGPTGGLGRAAAG